MKLPIQTDLGGKVAVVTGAGGVLCGMFAKALAASGAKVALLDLNLDAARKSRMSSSGGGWHGRNIYATCLTARAWKPVMKRCFPILAPATS